MKLRMATTTEHQVQQVYSIGTVLQRNRGVSFAAAAANPGLPDDAQVSLYGCTRPLIGAIKSKLAEHCFLRITDTNNHIIDSASFGQSGGNDRDKQEGGAHNCTNIATITGKQWKAIKLYFSGCGDYSVRTNNCCTCAVGALNASGLAVPKSFTDLNHGVGTTNQCVLQ